MFRAFNAAYPAYIPSLDKRIVVKAEKPIAFSYTFRRNRMVHYET